MSVRGVLENMRDILANSDEIRDWSINKYGREHTVFLGYDTQNPPKEGYWPSILIASILGFEKRLSRERYKIVIGYYIGNDTYVESNNTVTFPGFIDSEEFREVTEGVILQQKGLGKVEISASTEENFLFPLFTSMTIITIENVISSRS